MNRIISGLLIYVLTVTQVFAQAALVPNAKQTFLGTTGAPLASGQVFMYVPGSTNKKTTWVDPTQTSNNTNPIALDAAGRAIIWGQGSYRQVVKDKNGNTIWDAVTTSPGSSQPSGATGTDTAPVGAVMPYSGFTIPTNWQLAYGQAVSRTTFSDLKSAITIVDTTVSCTSGSATLTGFVSTAQMRVGAPIEATCISTGVTIATIVSPTSVTVSSAASATSTVTATVFPWGNGDGVSTFNIPDLRGRVIAGPDAMGGTAASTLTSAFYGVSAGPPAAIGGQQSRSIAQANLPNVNFPVSGITLSDPGHGHPGSTVEISSGGAIAASGGAVSPYIAGGTSNLVIANNTTGITISSQGSAASGGSQIAFSIVQPTATLNYIIKVVPNTTGAGGVVSIGGMFGDIVCDSTLTCAPVTGINTIGCTAASTTQLGCVEPDGTTTVIAGGKLSAIAGIASQVTVGTTTVTGGTNGYLLYNNAGILGNLQPTGSGLAVLQTSPTILGHPTVEGVTSTGATGAGAIVFGTSPTIASPTLTGTVGGLGVIPNSVLVNSTMTVNGTTCTLGASCSPTAIASSIVIGTTAISGGTTTRVLFNNAGTVNEYPISGGGSVAMTTNAAMTTPTIAGLTVTGSFTATGLVTNADLVNSSTTVGGTTCTLGSPCTLTSVNGVTYPASFTSGGVPYASSASAISSSGVLAANAPVIGGGAGSAPTTGTRSGNTTVFGTTNGGIVTNDCVKWDANGNLVGAGAPCGTGGSITAGNNITVAGGVVSGAGFIPGGRLTLTSHVAVMTSTAAAQSTLYYTQYASPSVPYFNGTTDAIDTITSGQVSTAMAASSTGVLNANGVFDVWWEGNTHHNICVATNGSGGGWASDTSGSNTARGTGYSQLDTQTRGYITNANTVANCYNGSTNYGSIAANRLTYLGTIATDAGSAGVVSMNFGSSAAGGGAALLNVWNAYNREAMIATVIDSTASWSYTSATVRQANNSAGNSITFVSGQQIGPIAPGYGTQANPAGVNGAFCGIGWAMDSTSTKTRSDFVQNPTTSSFAMGLKTPIAYIAPQIGKHAINATENGDGTNACTFFGSSGGMALTAQFFQ